MEVMSEAEEKPEPPKQNGHRWWVAVLSWLGPLAPEAKICLAALVLVLAFVYYDHQDILCLVREQREDWIRTTADQRSQFTETLKSQTAEFSSALDRQAEASRDQTEASLMLMREIRNSQ